MLDTVSRFKKKYTLTLLCFFGGTGLAYMNNWVASDYMWFCISLLGIFGPLDLVDKEKIRQFSK